MNLKPALINFKPVKLLEQKTLNQVQSDTSGLHSRMNLKPALINFKPVKLLEQKIPHQVRNDAPGFALEDEP